MQAAAGKVGIAWALSLGGLSLADWQVILGLASLALAVIYTALQIWILVRDKIIRRQPPV